MEVVSSRNLRHIITAMNSLVELYDEFGVVQVCRKSLPSLDPQGSEGVCTCNSC